MCGVARADLVTVSMSGTFGGAAVLPGDAFLSRPNGSSFSFLTFDVNTPFARSFASNVAAATATLFPVLTREVLT